MANSIYNQLNNNNNFQNPNIQNLFQNPQLLINKFNNFKKMLQGDPEQIGLQLLQSGVMSQQEYNFCRQIAPQVRQILFKN